MNHLYKIIIIFFMFNIGYSQNEDIHFGITDVDSLRQGLWGRYDSLSGINTKETYLNDTLNGLKMIIQGRFLNEIYYDKGCKNDWAYEYYKGVLSEAILYDYGFIIYVRLYDFKGRIREEYGMKNGKKEGINNVYKKGKIRYSETFKNGINEGKVIHYYKRYGTPHYIYDYIKGKKTGDWIELDKEGNIINSNLHQNITRGTTP